MKIGDKFYSDINGGIEVTVIDTHYCGENYNYEETLLICVGDGLLLKYKEVTINNFGEMETKEPEFLDCICPIEDLQSFN